VQELVVSLRGEIVRGELEPGKRLFEESLASEFGVSRIPLREALRVLAAEGFVRSERYGGTFVAMLDTETANDLLAVRAVLEPLAAAEAAIRRTPEHLETLNRLLDEGARATREGRYEDTRALKVEFAEHLAIASQNTTLIALMHVVRHKIEWATSIEAIKRSARDERRARLKVLRELVKAIADRDPARAANAAAANIQATYSSQHWQPIVDVRFEAVGDLWTAHVTRPAGPDRGHESLLVRLRWPS
jgi:DNA-binding GntR family transcriptional regulator